MMNENFDMSLALCLKYHDVLACRDSAMSCIYPISRTSSIDFITI